MWLSYFSKVIAVLLNKTYTRLGYVKIITGICLRIIFIFLKSVFVIIIIYVIISEFNQLISNLYIFNNIMLSIAVLLLS